MMHKIIPVLVIMLSGCAQHNADRVSIDFEPMYPQEMPMESRAQMVGDIITVQFAESFQATKSQNAATAKSNDNSISLPTALGTPELSTKLGSSLANTFSGSGSSAQSNSLNGQVSVHVVRVFQNGNLEILGQKKLTLNNGDEYIRVHGIVRPKDINEKNIVSSDRIANANIQYIGAGDIAETGKKGWYSKILDTINPL
jgi:flagellar L-ring protein precursor FlgH